MLWAMNTIKKISVSEILDDGRFDDMVKEYAAEAKIAETPAPNPDRVAYRAMDRFGILRSFGAYEGDRLVGFICVLISRLPHYSALITTVESFYVVPGARKGGTGQRLLAAVEALSEEQGCACVLVTAPKGGRLARAMGAMGYRMSHEVYVKGL